MTAARRVQGDDSSNLSDGLHEGGGTHRVLVVGTDDWAIEQSAASLEDAGFGVLRCHEPGEPAFPCNALVQGRVCPLDVGFDVVVTVRARPLSEPCPAELGVICALHRGTPLVVAGVGSERPFGPWASLAVDQGGDVVTACEKVVGATPVAFATGARAHRPEEDVCH
ncbi:MAG TPA: hypothetical protein VN799_04040, partial [Acidimicrobiales bacterium]|nr:hypothetical protein [Acidimicrobiales bacterium]